MGAQPTNRSAHDAGRRRTIARAALGATALFLGLSGPVAAAGEAGGGALGPRLTLLVALGLALGCGAVAQFQWVGAGRRGGPATPPPPGARRTAGRGAVRFDLLAPGEVSSAARASIPGEDDEEQIDWPGQVTSRAGDPIPGVARTAREPEEAAWQGGATLRSLERPATDQMPLSRAEERCARAVTAAFALDRTATIAAFQDALNLDPDVQPTTMPGFWALPASGHADLARAFLRCGRPLDARSLLRVALLAHGPNRELERLLQSED